MSLTNPITPRAEAPNDPQLQDFYAALDAAGTKPLWTEREDLMPTVPQPRAVAQQWRWSDLYPLAQRAGSLVPVGRGGERRAIALANSGLPGLPYATPTLWAAIQYLGPGEKAPSHRHSQGAFRFVLQGEGVWTNVDGDPVAMRRGDLLLTPNWAYHEHHNTTDSPMAWLDGLDIPLVSLLDAGFFEFGPSELTRTDTPRRSRSERLWGHPGLTPAPDVAYPRRSSPLMAYRWEHTDAALSEQLALEAEGHPVVGEAAHALVRYIDPATGADALPTMRIEMHRLRHGTTTVARRVVGSAVWQVFDGEATFVVGGEEFGAVTGDVIAVPSWASVTISAGSVTNLFRFSDEPVYEALGLDRTEIGAS